MPSKGWGGYSFPKSRKHHYSNVTSLEVPAASDVTSEWNFELDSAKRLKSVPHGEAGSRSSTQSETSPRTSTSSESSSHSSTSTADSYWPFSPEKVFSLAFSTRLGFSRLSSRRQQAAGSRADLSQPRKRPMLLQDLPTDEGEREDYMTVVVGERRGKRETYVINKHLLTHHLFQTLMKCSEDMVGPESTRDAVIPLVFCDPALFLNLVQAVGANLTAEDS